MSDEVPGNAGGFLSDVVTGFGVGSQIAGYRLEEQVGQGGMAAVFRARDERLGRLVALKILAPALAADEAFRQRFVRESRAAAAVDDPHIVPVFEAGEASGALFIAMRFVPGSDVRTMMHHEGPLAPARVAAIISQVASALDAAHRAGLVHRDVKPGNMLVDAQPGRPDHVYLSDFGLSKGALSTSVGLTGAGQFLGTVDYISPEQIEGKPVDGRADEYALACATFEMLTGAPPFRRDEAMAVMYAQLSEPPPLVTSQRPDLPPATDQVFARALAKAPAQRYATCREFADALRMAFGLTPYDSGPGVILPAGQQPTQMAWPAAAVTAVDAVMPTSEAGIPGYQGAGGGPPAGGPRRRLSPVTLAGIGALALAGIAAAVAFAISPGHKPVSNSNQVHSPGPALTQPAKATPSQTPRPTVTPTVAQPVSVPATTAPPAKPPPTTASPTEPPPTTASPTATPSATPSATTASPAGTTGASG